MESETLYIFKDREWLKVSMNNMGFKNTLSYVPHVTEFPTQPLQGMLVYYSKPPIENKLLRRIKMAWLVLIGKLTIQENNYD